jgi:hypothetical protein
MPDIVRNVRDIDTADRRALEHVLGQHLAEDQQLHQFPLPSQVGTPISAATIRRLQGTPLCPAAFPRESADLLYNGGDP